MKELIHSYKAAPMVVYPDGSFNNYLFIHSPHKVRREVIALKVQELLGCAHVYTDRSMYRLIVAVE